MVFISEGRNAVESVIISIPQSKTEGSREEGRGGGESRRKGSGEFEMNKGARTCPYNTGSRKTISFFSVLRLLLLLLNMLI